MHRFFIFVTGATALLISGCRTYTPTPIDWQQETATWSPPTNRLTLTHATARQAALYFNPELNALRLKHAASSNIINQTGWWEDPSVNLDAQRFIQGVASSWIIDAPLTLTLPVNGVPGLERQAAAAYSYAAACAISVQERAMLAEVDRIWSLLVALHARIQIKQKLDKQLAALNPTAQTLLAAGELPVTEAAQLELEQLRLRAEIAQLAAEQTRTRLLLMRQLGFHPKTRVQLDFAEPEHARMPAIHEADLVRHPRVQEKLAQLSAAEADLRTEIRRQYPDITLGPAGGYEEGDFRAGLSFGMTLPLWNRNRLAIAKSDAERAHIRREACAEWRLLVSELHTARRAYAAAEKQEHLVRTEELPRAKANFQRMERLYRTGEADLFRYRVVFQTLATAQLNAIDAQQALRDAWITLSTFAE